MSNYEERKQRKEWYIEECKKSVYEDPTIELVKKIFISAELEEEAFGKDVSEFNDNEAIDFLKSLNSKSRSRLKNTAWFLSRYRQWYYNKQGTHDLLNPFDDKTIDKIIENIIPIDVITDKIITKTQLKEYVDIEPDYKNKFMAICPYYSIKGDEFEDIVNIKMEDLDRDTKTLKLISGRTVQVDDYFITHMEKANNAEQYITLQESNSRNYKQRVYIKNGYVLSPTASLGDLFDYKPATSKFISQRMILVRKNVKNEYFTMANLYKNGLMNFIKEKFELKGISLKTAFYQESDGIYVYEKEIQQYVDEFGSKMTTRMLRMQLGKTIDLY